MQINQFMILLIGLFFLAGAGSAAVIPDQNSTIVSNSPWVVVNHPSVITVTALNTTSIPVPGATVTASLNSTTLGVLTASSGTTDANGQVNFPFSAGTKSGAVNFTATITYNDNGNISSVTKVYTQNIDHDIAQNAVFDFQNEVTVGTETPFNISFTDQYGNPIDNRNPNKPPIISLWISASSDNVAAFNISGSHVQSTSLELDAKGNISVTVVTDTVPGENEILLYPFGNVGKPWGVPQFIYGINNGIPYSIDMSVLPASLTQPADNGVDHVFTLNNTVYDKYGNPTENQGITVQSNWPGDPSATMRSNPYGQIMYTYGPHSASGYVVLTATSVSNSSVTISKTVQFYNTAPVNMLFSATPQVMPSLDATPGETAQLVAKVVDTMGNPVSNQTVTFSMGAPTYTYPNSSISGPQLLTSTAVTNINGTATVIFKPGKFDTNKANVSYDPTDTGYVTVTATWNTISQPIQLSWKNYPYLSEQTTITPQNVNVNGNFTVTISLTADGWNLTGTPADVVIVSDLAAGIGGATRLSHTKSAEVGFIKNATDNTYISLASFGSAPNAGSTPYASADTRALWNQQISCSTYSLKPFNPYGNVWDYNLVDPAHWDSITSSTAYCFNSSTQKNPGAGRACVNATNPMIPTYSYLNPWSDAKIDTDLMNAGPTYPGNQNSLINTVNAYTAYGGTDYAAGLNAALLELKNKGNPTHNQTIIIMGDGVNMMAPIAPGSLESYWPSDWNPRNGTGTSEGPNLWWLDESDVGKAASLDAANTAKSKGITIYGIQFPTPDNSGHNLNDTAFFKSMVSSPSGTWYYAPDPTTMTGIFQLIEGNITNTAGVNTTMALNLQSVAVTYNNVTTNTPGNQVFAYIYDPQASTKIVDQNGNITVVNQTAQWINNQTLIFNIGKMTVGQTWSTTFELQLLKPGTMDIPGNQSTICFNTGECMQPNGNAINGIYNYSNTGFGMPTIAITDLQALQDNGVTNVVPLQWNISYPGSQFATETLYYNSQSDPTWRFINQEPVTSGNWTHTYNWNVGGLPAGTYSIEVIAYAHDANSGKEIIPGGIELGLSPKAFIRLQ